MQQLLGCGGGAGSSSRGHETIAGTAKAAEVEAAVADAVAYEANEAARVAVHPLLARKDRGGFTPLLMAAWCGHEDLTMQLLIAGADPTILNALGETPRECAARHANMGAVDVLRAWDESRFADATTASALLRRESIN